jgi:hypothetical protein
VVDDELAPVMIVGDGVVDGVLRMTANSNPWSLTTGASRGDGEVRLEATAASVIVRELEKLQEKVGQWCHSMRQREGRRIGESRSEGRLHRVDTDENRWWSARSPARDSSSLAAPNREGEGRERRGGAGLYSGGS